MNKGDNGSFTKTVEMLGKRTVSHLHCYTLLH